MLLNYFLAQKLAESYMKELLGEAEDRRIVMQSLSRPTGKARRRMLWAWRLGGIGAVGLVAWGLVAALQGAG